MTPAPITPRRFGTASKSSAPQESTMHLPSTGTVLSAVGSEPEARITLPRREHLLAAIRGGEFDLVAGQQPAVSAERR